MTKETIEVKLQKYQLDKIVDDTLRNLSLVFMCGYCRQEIIFSTFGEIICDHCGKRMKLSLLIEPLDDLGE